MIPGSVAEGGGSIEQVIVTPTKNRLPLLKRSVESVVSQKYPRWRLIIVNDGSVDGTHEYLENLTKTDSRIAVIHHERSRGVNAARNAAFGLLHGDEYVSFLDDDDYLLPDALAMIAKTIVSTPSNISAYFFNTYRLGSDARREQGFSFDPGQTYYDLSYYDVMTRARRTGDCYCVFQARLFSGPRRYRYPEDINGYESQVLILMARDGVGIRTFPLIIADIDHTHNSPHLSEYAARSDRASFTRAHLRAFRDHREFFAEHPMLAMSSALGSARVALGSFDLPHALVFAAYWLQGLWRLVFFRHPQEKDHL